jgi:hydrogenase maturation protease
MNTKPIDAIANALLYEGYMLYPYRPSSVKNRQRFNFGVLYPKRYSEETGSDPYSLQTEVLVEGVRTTALEVRVRFLKLVDRVMQRQAQKPMENVTGPTESFEHVPQPGFDPTARASWQEAIECDVAVPAALVGALEAAPLQWTFAFPRKEESESLRDADGRSAETIVRKQEALYGTVEVGATRVTDELFKVRVRVNNTTPFQDAPRENPTGQSTSQSSRDHALMRSLVSAHVRFGAKDGCFVSLLEPPGSLTELAASCENVGAWPVLVGAPGEHDTMLASPIILYDYPQIAPESPGDLFDGTEIDEILALRIMTMTDDEKREMRNSDARARKILERTESLPIEHLRKLHGTLREMRPELHPSGLREETP